MMPAKRTVKPIPETATVDFPLSGRDEMNLADHPISVLTDRADRATKTLVFRNAHGTLTITGSDAHGLPTAQAADVMVALIQLAKQKNDFKEFTVNFTRYELLRLLRWPNEGKSYRRLNSALKCLQGITLNYDGCWYEKRTNSWGDAYIHIIESVVILEGSAKGDDDGAQHSLPLSSFEWNRKFIENCRAGNLKHLDLSLYFSLEHPSSKRLYRFLDKRFYLQPDWLFDLAEIAFERVGLSRNYADAGKIKEKLQPAIDELEGKGFLQPLSRDERYVKDGKAWKVRFIQQPPALAEPAPSQDAAVPEQPLVAELVKRGVTRATAVDLAQQHPAEFIQAKIDVFDWLAEKKDKRIEKSPAGYLVKSIASDYATPKGFVSRAERQQAQQARQAKERHAAEERRRQHQEEARERADRENADAYLKQLTPVERVMLEVEVIAQASPDTRETLESPGMARFRDTLMLGLLRQHVAEMLRSREPAAAEA